MHLDALNEKILEGVIDQNSLQETTEKGMFAQQIPILQTFRKLPTAALEMNPEEKERGKKKTHILKKIPNNTSSGLIGLYNLY